MHGAVSLPEPVGQVDFYPNGGSHQAGCTEICIGGFSCIGFDLIDFILGKEVPCIIVISLLFYLIFFKGGGACSHKRAHKVYVESIKNPQISFMSTECDSYESFESGYCDGNNIAPMGEGLLPSM